MHLRTETFAALLSGTLDPAEADALAVHLERDCEECDRFLAGATGVGPGHRAGEMATGPSCGAGSDSEFERIMERVRASR